MNQNIWGPNLWFSLHTMTFVYPLKPSENDKKNYKLFFESLQFTIPCSVCRKNYIRHWKEYPIDKNLNSRKELVYWLIDLHNIVNSETGKKTLSYETVIQKYEKVYGKKLILEGTKDMDESEQSLSHNLLYDEENLAVCVQQYFNYSWVKILLIIFLILLILCFIKKYLIKK
jgi:hypothetical protein